MSKKQVIRLTENQLHQIVKECVKKLVNEYADGLDGIENNKTNYQNHYINHELRVVEYGDKVFILYKGKVVGEFDDYYQADGNVYATIGDSLSNNGYCETYYIDTKGGAHLLTKEYPDGRVENFEKEPEPKRYFGGSIFTKKVPPTRYIIRGDIDKHIDKETGLHRNTSYIMGDGEFKEKHTPSQRDLYNLSFDKIYEAVSKTLRKYII